MKIKSEEEYETALKEVSDLLEDLPQQSEVTEVEKRLEDLVSAIELWEDVHHPVGPPTPSDSVEFHYDRVKNYLNPLIAVVGEHPECKWRVRPMTENEKSRPGTRNRTFVLEMEGVDLYATGPEVVEFFDWLLNLG